MPLVESKSGIAYQVVHSEKGKVFLLPSSGMVRGWRSGVIIHCKKCGNEEIVAEGSLCDSWKLCSSCTRKILEEKI